METVQIRLHPMGKVLAARRGSPLKDVLHETGVEFPCGGKGTCGKCAVRILKGLVKTDSRHEQQLEKLGLAKGWRLACQSSCDEDLVVAVEQFEAIIKADETPFDFTPGKGLGVAVDLGTTTLVAQLVNLENGHILAVETALNPQRAFGNDLITRLEAALAGGKDELTGMIRSRIGEMVAKLCETIAGELSKIVIVGNTVMQHLFCGSDIKPLSFYPFESPELGMRKFIPQELGWNVQCREITFYPSIGSFVGSDILAGIAATGMHQSETFSVLIDLGTNGEIVAGNREGLLCASTAAGPAFEGARISQGMLATTGAVASVHAIGKKPSYRVIGDVDPRGICGSGLIDAVGVMLKEGLLGEFGEISSGEQEIVIAPPVSLTQRDIQEFQLAKAAIAAGTGILLNKLGVEKDKIENVYFAGAFGNYIRVENVLRTGMLNFKEETIHQLGNTAIMGARMFLFPGQSFSDDILRMTSHINLESEKQFQDYFVDHLSFTLSGGHLHA